MYPALCLWPNCQLVFYICIFAAFMRNELHILFLCITFFLLVHVGLRIFWIGTTYFVRHIIGDSETDKNIQCKYVLEFMVVNIW